MTNDTEVRAETPTVAELEALFFGNHTYRVVPCFCEADEIDAAERQLRHLMGAAEIIFTIDSRDDGVARLRRMAARDARCSDFVMVADMLATFDAGSLLVLGWSRV